MDVGEIVGVELERSAHNFLHCSTATVMFYGIFRGVTALEHAYVGGRVPALLSAMCVPTVPDGTERRSPVSRSSGAAEGAKQSGYATGLPVWREMEWFRVRWHVGQGTIAELPSPDCVPDSLNLIWASSTR